MDGLAGSAMIELVQAASQLRAPVLIGYTGVAILLVGLAPSSNRRQLSSCWFVFLSLTVLVVLRLPKFFLNAQLNPDEAQFLASAIKFTSVAKVTQPRDLTSESPGISREISV